MAGSILAGCAVEPGTYQPVRWALAGCWAVGHTEEPPAEPDRIPGAQRPGRGDGRVLLAWAGAGRQRGEGPAGVERGRVLVDGDNALPVLVDDEVAGGDRLVERVSQFLPLSGVDQQQAGREPVLLDVADAVVAPPFQGDGVQQLGQRRVGVVLVVAGHPSHPCPRRPLPRGRATRRSDGVAGSGSEGGCPSGAPGWPARGGGVGPGRANTSTSSWTTRWAGWPRARALRVWVSCQNDGRACRRPSRTAASSATTCCRYAKPAWVASWTVTVARSCTRPWRRRFLVTVTSSPPGRSTA